MMINSHFINRVFNACYANVLHLFSGKYNLYLINIKLSSVRYISSVFFFSYKFSVTVHINTLLLINAIISV